MTGSSRLAAHRAAVSGANAELTKVNANLAAITDPEIPTPASPDEDEDEETETTPTSRKKDKPMTDTTEAALVAARAEGFTEANARATTVIASDHYAGREALAASLLSNDKMSAEEITTALATAPKIEASALLTSEQQLAAAEEGGRKEMQAALKDGKNSNIDANGGGDTPDPKAAAGVWDTAIANVFPNQIK